MLQEKHWVVRTISLVLATICALGPIGCSASRSRLGTAEPIADIGKEQGSTSQYRLSLGTEDQLQFNVHVWGQVNKPGLYVVADGTDLISLISLAGGPTDDAKLANIVLVRTEGSRPGRFTVNLETYFSSGSRTQIPILGPGDTVMVPAKYSHYLLRFSGILSVAALIANVVVNATR